VLALRYVYVLALAIWLGGMVVLGAVVAPATFQVLQAIEPVNGRPLAGEAFGAILARFHFVAYGAGAVLLFSLAAMALLGPRPRSFAVRSAIIAVMLAVALYSGYAVLREVDAIQLEVGGLPSKLPPEDPRRIRFDELHELSTRLMMLNIVGTLVLVYWEARDHGER
jgi:MFS superfamily sulfate permease-like transporter